MFSKCCFIRDKWSEPLKNPITDADFFIVKYVSMFSCIPEDITEIKHVQKLCLKTSPQLKLKQFSFKMH